MAKSKEQKQVDKSLKKFSVAPPVRAFVFWTIVLVALFASVAGWLSDNLVTNRTLDLIQEVESRTAMQAQSRATVLKQWLDGRLEVARNVTDSESMRLFVTELAQQGAPADDVLEEGAELNPVLAQTPYMTQLLKEFSSRYNLEGAHILTANGTLELSSQEGMTNATEDMRTGVAMVTATREPQIGTLRIGRAQELVMDVLLPIFTLAPAAEKSVVGVMMTTWSVRQDLNRILAPQALDQQGERSTLVQKIAQDGLVSLFDGKLMPLSMPESQLVSFAKESGASMASALDGNSVFARLAPVMGTPFFVLQEYDSAAALQFAAFYRQSVFGMISLATLALGALILAIIAYLLAQRNRSRVRMLGQTMDALVRSVEIRDPYLSGHHMRTARLAVRLGNVLNLSVNERATLFYAAQLSGVGKIFVPQKLLTKKGKLTEKERATLEGHVYHATQVLSDIDFDLPIVSVIRQMYEREDGSGYPAGDKADDIHTLSKVLGVCDAFCAMTEPRSYREAMKAETALSSMQEGDGFDPKVMKALLKTQKV